MSVNFSRSLTRIQELQASSLKGVRHRKMPGYFTNMVEHCVVEISHGRDRKAEDDWIAEHVRHPWARTRFEDFVRYFFVDDVEAIHFKLMFG